MSLMTFDETLDQLRGRFMRLRNGVPLHMLAEAVGVHAVTLKRFVDGDDASMIVIRKIDAWCHKQRSITDV